jgi:hypothetical protein
MEYLPTIARRLHHSRELGEPFDFLTWFEYAPEHNQAFEELVVKLRATEEWEGRPLPRRLNLCGEEIEHIREGKHGARSWPEWRSDSSDDFGVVRRAFDDGFGKRGGRQTAENVE